MRMLHVKGWGWLEGDTKWTQESPAKFKPEADIVYYQHYGGQIYVITTILSALLESATYCPGPTEKNEGLGP